MNPKFKQALENGYLRPAIHNGQPMEIEGKKYYEPTDFGAKMAIGRYHVALDLVRMHEELRISFAQLNTYVNLMKQTAKDILKETDVGRIKEWAVEQLKASETTEARLGFGRDTEQVYQIAAIWFVHPDEDPGHISFSALDEKARHFMSRPDLYSFFLSLPLSHFLGSSVVSDIDTLNFSQSQVIQEMEDKVRFLLNMKKLGIGNELTSSFFLRMETLTGSANSNLELLRITTNPSQPSSEMQENQP